MGERSHARSIKDDAGEVNRLGEFSVREWLEIVGTWRNRQRQDRGQGLVEFALVLPIIMILLLGALDFGRLFMSYVTLTNATRVAANFGATDPSAFTGTLNTATYDAIVVRETAGLNCALRGGDPAHPPIPTYPGGTGLGFKSVATMTCDFSFLTPLITNLFGGPLAITASSEFPIRTGAIANIGGGIVVPPPGSAVAAFAFNNVSGGVIDGSGNVTGAGSVTVNVTNQSQNAQFITWDWGDTQTDSGSAPPAHTYSNPGTYVVTLTVSNPVNTDTATRTVTVGSASLPVAGFYGTPVAGGSKYVLGGGSSGDPIFGSLNLAVQFTNTSSGGTSYSWDFGDGSAPSTTASPTYTYLKLGVFTVTLTMTAPTGASPQVRTKYVTTGCVVPNFASTSTSNAQASWGSNAGFSGSIWYHESGKNGNGSKNAPSPSKIIVSQTIPGGTFVAATKQGQNWECAGDITLDYTP